MKIISHIVFFVLSFIAQLTVGNLIEVFGVQPDFLLIAVVWLAWHEKQFVATLAGFGVGLLQDLFSSGFLGLMALAKSIAGFAAGKLSPSEKKNQRRGLFLTLIICSLLHESIFQTIFYFGSEQSWWAIFIQFILPGAVYTSILGVIVYQILPKRYWLK